MPGVSFELEDGIVKLNLRNIGKLTAVQSDGRNRMRAFLAGDPPRKIVTRVLRVTIRPGAEVRHLACYDINRDAEPQLAAFLRRVESEMTRF